MKSYRMVIADADESFSSFLQSAFSSEKQIEIVGCASDGISALNLILNVKPDIVLMDPILPGMDGLLVLNELKKARHKPMIVCLSRFYTSVSIEIARRYGASYYIYKPIAPESLLKILLECAETFHQDHSNGEMQAELSENCAVRHRIHALMHELGFSSKLSGSRYITESIVLAAETPSCLHNLSAGLYAQLAQKTNLSAACIERSIRTAIAKANANGQLSRRIGSAPTNKACIRYILSALNSPEM